MYDRANRLHPLRTPPRPCIQWRQWKEMNMRSKVQTVFRKIRRWGIKGIFDYLKHKLTHTHDDNIREFLKGNATTYPMTPTKGITIISDMRHGYSLSKGMRDLAFALKKGGIPFQILDTGKSGQIPESALSEILTPKDSFRALRYDHIIEISSDVVRGVLPIKTSIIFFWEFESGLKEGHPHLAEETDLIGMSDFCVKVLSETFPKASVKKILYPFHFNFLPTESKVVTRARYGITEDAFVVFFNFDYHSSFNRKNPDGVLRAFAKAFPPGKNENVMLVFKTMSSKIHPEEVETLKRLACELGQESRFISIDDYIPQKDLYELTDAADVYISLHRGEGLGLGVAEAMSLGKAVIVSDCSSTTEFCDPENSIPIPCSLKRLTPEMRDHPSFIGVTEWPDPDIDQAAQALRILFDDPELRQKKGILAKESIERHFSPQRFAESINTFLDS